MCVSRADRPPGETCTLQLARVRLPMPYIIGIGHSARAHKELTALYHSRMEVGQIQKKLDKLALRRNGWASARGTGGKP